MAHTYQLTKRLVDQANDCVTLWITVDDGIGVCIQIQISVLQPMLSNGQLTPTARQYIAQQALAAAYPNGLVPDHNWDSTYSQ